MSKAKTANGVQNILTPSQEQMRSEVVDLELKARYWKAQYEIRHYTLQAEEIQTPYNAYLEEQRKLNEELQKKYQESIDKMNKAATKVESDIAEGILKVE
jgi:uncharacterized protein (DUF3084 family)